MDISAVQDAVQQLEARGVPLAEITSPMVREITGYGSYSSITEHLRMIRGEAPAGSEAIEDGSSENNTTALATITSDDTAGEVDVIADAEQHLVRAKARVGELEAEIPKLEAYLAEARREVFVNAQAHLAWSFAASKGVIPSGDLSVRASEEQMWASGRLLRQLQEMYDALPQRLQAAQGAVRLATQALAKARHLDRLKAEQPAVYAEYEQAIAELKAFEPDYEKPGESIRRKARLQQRVEALEAQIREFCEGFERLAV